MIAPFPAAAIHAIHPGEGARVKFVYRMDERDWPLVYIASPGPRPPSDIDQDSFYAELERLLAKGQRFATLHDLRDTRPDAKRRQRFSEWLKANHDRLARRLVAHAVLVDSTFQRGMITAILWMTTSPPCPMKVFDDRAEAEAWLRSMIDA